jgi:O-antigen/teichoic acid export membrane protein
MAIGYLYQVFSIADRTLVAWVKGTEAVGNYALAGLAVTAIQSVYTPLAVATYSKANHAYGRSHSVVPLIRSMKRFLILVTVSVVPIAVAIYFILPIAIPWLLPKYVAGIRAGQIACIASVAFCYCGTGFIYNVTGHNLVYGVLMGCAVAGFFLIGFLIPANELTLERVAWLRTGITVCLCLLSNAYLGFYIRRELRRETETKYS